ncbi:leucine Rich repeats (2 copies) [Holospora elegans E1]|uniref:Leucine Rich repeats (2 copies) n=1 Tax=Holospora elegans E1 TaxID=1427503 RepID=A0A023DYJ8_9PROT|nr:leucine Rich repeats (2 copies) [Holospora elegans E1]
MFKILIILFVVGSQILFASNFSQKNSIFYRSDKKPLVKKFKFYCNKEYTEDYYGEDIWVKGLKKIALLGKKIPDHARSIEIKEDIQDPENLKEIDFNKVESLKFSYMSSDIHPEFQLENLVGAKFPDVKFFSVYCSGLTDLSPLKKISLPSLEELDFSKNGIQDISAFKHLSFPKLKKLSLAWCNIKDITPLLSFSAPLLEEINFCRNEELSVSLEDAEKLKKQFPLLKKIVILRTINEENWGNIIFQSKAVFANKGKQ